jgi:hypothetical protein
MIPPIRKKMKPITVDEIMYLKSNYDKDTIKLMKANNEEVVIPEADELQDYIEKNFKSINGKPLGAKTHPLSFCLLRYSP